MPTASLPKPGEFDWRRPDLIAPLALVLAVVVFFGRVLFGGRVLLPADNLVLTLPWRAMAGQLGVGAPHNHLLGDMLFQNLAWKQFARETLLRGELPLWNPYVFGGEPFLAAGQQSVLYPPGILFYLLPTAQAYGWFTALHVLLAGLGALVVVGIRLVLG